MLHPSLALLLRYHGFAKLRRLRRGFQTRRRMILSTLGIVLAVIWLGNAALSIVFRPPSDPSRLTNLVSLGLLGYALWHVVKVACRRPEESIEWSSAERETLAAAPLTRAQLISYRMASILMSALLKATCFTLLMLPDLKLAACGFVGAFLSLTTIDLMRVNIEITAWGAARHRYLLFRVTVFAMAAVVGAYALLRTLVFTPLDPTHLANPLNVIMRLLGAASELCFTPVGLAVTAPFVVFGRLITASTINLDVLLSLATAAMLVWGLTRLVRHLDTYYHFAVIRRERIEYEPTQSANNVCDASHVRRLSLPRPALAGGATTLAWRQFLGAKTYASSLVVALAAPGFLSCLPLLVVRDPEVTLLSVAVALAFYSFLLLPSALKFDFRRDIDRMVNLKALPLRPRTVVLGQLATPVVLTSILQAVVLAITTCVRAVPLTHALTAWLILVPANVLIFGLDNLIFLLYPHRLNQEGIEVFLRATLTFTAKGLLFAVGLVMTLVWAVCAAEVARACEHWIEPETIRRTIFVAGLWVLLAGVAASLVASLTAAFSRFDPSQDLPG